MSGISYQLITIRVYPDISLTGAGAKVRNDKPLVIIADSLLFMQKCACICVQNMI